MPAASRTPDCTGHGDAPDGQQIRQREVQPDAEHEQDHADLGQLRGEVRIGHESRRERTDHDPGHQEPGDGCDTQPVRDQAEHERRDEGTDQRRDQGGHRVHRRTIAHAASTRDVMHSSSNSHARGPRLHVPGVATPNPGQDC